MLTVLLSWVIFTLVILCFGDLLVLFWNKLTGRKEKYRIVDTFWLGIVFISLLICLLSLFIPLNVFVTFSFFLITLIYWIINRKRLLIVYHKIYCQLQKQHWGTKVILISVFILILLYSLISAEGYDIGLYHLQVMEWSDMYRVVPGLGNLHGRFSFNSNALLIYLLFYRPDYFLSTFTINGLFLLIIAFWTIIYAAQLHKITQTIALLGILVAFFITYISTITSTSTNLLVNILCVYLLLKYIFENKSFTKDYLIYFSLPLLCITLKLSSIFICLLALILIYNIIQKKNYRILNVLLLLSFLIIAPWITRFIITSGYFIYPYPSIDIFNFDWKIPIESVIQEKESIYAWSRLADKSPEVVLSMPLNEWLPIWLSRLHKIEILVYSLSSISILTMLLFIRNINKYKKYFLAWGIAYIGFFFGFLTVPNSTYTLGFITCAAFIPFILLKKTYIIIRIEKYKILQSLAYLFFIIILLNILQHGVKGIIKNQEDSDSYLSLLYKPQPVFKTNQTNINVKEYKIGKTIIYTPIDGDRCFDHCIPCTPYINNSLIMRGETLQNGFKIKK